MEREKNKKKVSCCPKDMRKCENRAFNVEGMRAGQSGIATLCPEMRAVAVNPHPTSGFVLWMPRGPARRGLNKSIISSRL